MPGVRSQSAAVSARCALAIATILILLLSKSLGQQVYIDRQSNNVTVLLGRLAAFHCSSVDLRADGSSTILWFRNQTLIHQLPPEYNASSVTSPRADVARGENSTLTVLGSKQTNGTMYRCGILDVATTSIAEYSALITLSVQGSPFPPTGLRLSITFSRELNTYSIMLTWMPPRTLFDEFESDTNRYEITYFVYTYKWLNSSASPRLLHVTETGSLSMLTTLRDLDVEACNLSIVSFRVSAKFEGVREGNMSNSIQFDDRLANDICMTVMRGTEHDGGLQGSGNDNTNRIIGASIGSIFGILIIVFIIIVVAVIVYRRINLLSTEDSKMTLSANGAYGTAIGSSIRKTSDGETETCTDNIPAVEGQHVYEHVRDVVKGTMRPVETHPNQAYEPINIGKE